MVFGDYLSALLSAVSKNIEVLFHLHRCSFPFCFRQIATNSYSLLLESSPQMWSSSSARLTLIRTTQNILAETQCTFCNPQWYANVYGNYCHLQKVTICLIFKSIIERRKIIPQGSSSTMYKRIAQDFRVTFSEAYWLTIIHSEFLLVS